MKNKKKKTILAERIKKLRNDHNLTQEELAKKLELNNKSSIANYESGYSIPSDEIKKKMCKEFNCTMDYLMGNSQQKTVSINENSFADVKKYYDEKINVTLKNKYISEFFKLGLKDSEIDNLVKVITSEDEEVNKNYISLLNSLFYFLSSNYDENTLNKIKDLILAYNEEKIIVLTEQQQFCQKEQKLIEQKLIDEHIDELHPSISGKTSASLFENLDALLNYLDKNNIDNFCMCPVYGQISAETPNWEEKCIEGRLPIGSNMVNIVDIEKCFFLRVNDENMDKVITNGGYALIRKQDYAEDGDIVVVIINGDKQATLKKFKRFNEQFVSFEPMSSDESIKPINVDLKNTNVIILGKYIGKFEMK